MISIKHMSIPKLFFYFHILGMWWKGFYVKTETFILLCEKQKIWGSFKAVYMMVLFSLISDSSHLG